MDSAKYFVSHSFFLDQITKIKILYMVASEHPEVIKWRQRLIGTDVPDSEDAAEDVSIGNDGASLD